MPFPLHLLADSMSKLLPPSLGKGNIVIDDLQPFVVFDLWLDLDETMFAGVGGGLVNDPWRFASAKDRSRTGTHMRTHTPTHLSPALPHTKQRIHPGLRIKVEWQPGHIDLSLFASIPKAIPQGGLTHKADFLRRVAASVKPNGDRPCLSQTINRLPQSRVGPKNSPSLLNLEPVP